MKIFQKINTALKGLTVTILIGFQFLKLLKKYIFSTKMYFYFKYLRGTEFGFRFGFRILCGTNFVRTNLAGKKI